jgi:hypothetical protein
VARRARIIPGSKLLVIAACCSNINGFERMADRIVAHLQPGPGGAAARSSR